MAVTVTPVTGKRDLDAFLHLPVHLYRDDPNAVLPLESEMRGLLDKEKNPFYRHAETELWLARRDGRVTGRVSACIDRYNNEPMASNMLAAIVFEELSQATGNKLWSGKAEALAVAVLQAQHPELGHSNTGLEPNVAEHDSHQFNDAKFRHWDFSRGWSAQLLREFAALKSK